jgi:ketosteroid isomerase-like protein
MSRSLIVALALNCLTTAAVAAQTSTVTAGQTAITLPDTGGYAASERLILRAEIRRSEAIAAHDTAWLATLYAADFQGVVANGLRVDRSALFAVFSRDNPGARFTIDELAVRALSPDAAVVTGRLASLAPDGSTAFASRYLHVYVLRPEGWRLVAAEGTAVRP